MRKCLEVLISKINILRMNKRADSSFATSLFICQVFCEASISQQNKAGDLFVLVFSIYWGKKEGKHCQTAPKITDVFLSLYLPLR